MAFTEFSEPIMTKSKSGMVSRDALCLAPDMFPDEVETSNICQYCVTRPQKLPPSCPYIVS